MWGESTAALLTFMAATSAASPAACPSSELADGSAACPVFVFTSPGFPSGYGSNVR